MATDADVTTNDVYDALHHTSKDGTSSVSNKPKPGEGWSNGDVPQSMFNVTREGRVSLYASQRRWINAKSSWTRIGTGSELDAKHSDSASGHAVVKCEVEEAKTKRALIAQLCEKFYSFGWATGTGGGVSIRTGGPSENRPWRVFVAPSGIQKEDMIGDDIFELDMDMNVVVPPKTPNLRQSACTPLWYVVYNHRPNARCVIHTHSMHAQLATLLDPTEKTDVLRLTHLEMLKGVGNHAYDCVLEVPIIDNRPTEDQLAAQMEAVIQKYPKCNAVLVRRHGVYVWGDSWEQAKTQCESFDYLFESAVKMRSMGLDPGVPPMSGTYREDEGLTTVEGVGKAEEEGPPHKRRRVEEPKKSIEGDATSGFNAAGATDNVSDLEKMGAKAVPLLPRDSKVLLLDIEGCTTSISFVKDTLFPFVLDHLDAFVGKMSYEDALASMTELKADVEKLDDGHEARKECEDVASSVADGTPSVGQMQDVVKGLVRGMMKHDVKATGLKSLQGKMWKSGYESGELLGHTYSDFLPTLLWCNSNHVAVSIYSSGSIGAQKLLFGHTSHGDLTSHFHAHFDTTSGSKKEAESYRTIAKTLMVPPSDIVFVSDAEAELVAAREAGIGHPVMSVRPGNAPLTDVGREFPIIGSLLQLCGSNGLD